MILSIGMIVKNEEKYLEQCLNSIRTILENVDSELIIADTGSTDRTVEIARKFTDKVFYFEWIKDFAAARNSTLEKAQGEWYMFIDADEILTSCSEIIDFFNSGEYKKYNSASYIVRNFECSHDSGRYNEFQAPRLTAIKSGTKFINPVHEILSTFGAPVRYFSDYAEHYGYYFENQQDKNLKMQRNTEILLKRIETEGDDPMLYQQLYDSYYNIDKKKAEEYIEKGLAAAEKRKSIVFFSLLTSKINGMYMDGRYEETVDGCDKYFSYDVIKNGKQALNAEISGFRAAALYSLGRYKEALAEYQRFFRLFESNRSGKSDMSTSTMQVMTVATDRQFPVMAEEFINACIFEKEYELAVEYLSSFDISSFERHEKQVSRLICKAVQLLEKADFKNIDIIFSHCGSYGKRIFLRQLRTRIIESENINAALDAYSLICAHNDKQLLCGIYKAFADNDSGFEEKVSQFADKADTSEYGELIYMMMKRGSDISPLLLSRTADPAGWVRMCHVYIGNFYKAAEEYDVDCIGCAGALVPSVRLYEYIIKAAAKFGVNGDRLLEVFVRLGEKCLEHYQGEVPAEGLSAVRLKKIDKLRENGDYRRCIAELKDYIADYPLMLSAVAHYQRRVLNEYETSQPATEMQRLAAMIKNNIKNYIASGNIDAAVKTLAEYEKINPSDPEIAVLKAEIQ